MDDPRIEAVADAILESMATPNKTMYFPLICADNVIDAADAADRAAHIVRVDTRDAATVQRIAAALGLLFGARSDSEEEQRREDARAILAALREAGGHEWT